MASYKVLFIDDDPDVLRSLGAYFEQLGHQVYRASSGKEGVAAWEREQPDVTVLDLYMPEMNGLKVLEKLRSKRAMVIMLTAHGEIESAVQAMNLGAENFLTKPIDMPHLAQAVEKAVEKQALRRENVELRSQLRPSVRRRLVIAGVFLMLVMASLGLGSLIGGGGSADVRPSRPIPVPLDTIP